MTAYGRSTLENKIGNFVCEIQTINRKYLDILVNLPSEMSQFDSDVRKWVSEYANRGRIQVKILVNYEEVSPISVKADLVLARQIKQAWDKIASELGLNDGFSLEMLKVADVLKYQVSLPDEEQFKDILKTLVIEALKSLQEMKISEGKALLLDIENRIVEIKESVGKIRDASKQAPVKYRDKLIRRIEENFGMNIEEDERLLKEVALYADRVDIQEEITRLVSHLDQLQMKLEETDPVGKTLEFIVQECFREINTIGSKTEEIEVKNQVVLVKTELERIREQIQNVE